MSAAPLHFNRRMVSLYNLFIGGRETAERLVSVGPVPPSTRNTVGDEGLGQQKQFGSKAFQGDEVPRVALLGFGNIRRDGTVSYPDEPTLSYGPKVHDYVVRPGDILFRNRGYAGSDKVSVAAYIDQESHNAALRSLKAPVDNGCFVYNSSLFRIRLRDGYNDAPEIEPEYLAAYINSSEAQRYLAKNSQGIIATGIKKKDLLDLPVALPSLPEQKQLVQLIRAQAEYARVSDRLSDCYGLLTNLSFNRF